MNWNWIAGFYEGEGYAATQIHKNKTSLSSVLHLVLVQKEKSVLTQIYKFYGAGGMRQRADGVWYYYLYGKSAAVFAKRILPRMYSPRKIKQLTKALKKWEGR